MLYFYDCITALNNILFAVHSDSTGVIIEAFDQRCVLRLEALIGMVANDIKDFLIDIDDLNAYNCNFVEVLRQFICRIRDYQNPMKEDKARLLISVCNILLNDLNDKLNTDITMHETKVKKLTSVLVMDVVCLFSYKRMKEEKRQFRIRSDVSLIELLMQVESRFQISPLILTYVTHTREPIVVNSEKMLRKAINNAFNRSADRTVKLVFSAQISPSIADSELPIEMLCSALPCTEDEFLSTSNSWSNLSQKASLLLNLNKSTRFTISGLSAIYAAFYQITKKRLLHKDEGYLTFPEFTDLMLLTLKHEHFCTELFNAIAKGKDRVDFRELVLTLSILQFGSMEEKASFAFTLYDTDNSHYIDANKLRDLIKHSAKAMDMAISLSEVYALAESTFEHFDIDRDGKLSLAEFKNAVSSRLMSVEPYWTSTSFVFTEESFQPRSGIGINEQQLRPTAN